MTRKSSDTALRENNMSNKSVVTAEFYYRVFVRKTNKQTSASRNFRIRYLITEKNSGYITHCTNYFRKGVISFHSNSSSLHNVRMLEITFAQTANQNVLTTLLVARWNLELMDAALSQRYDFFLQCTFKQSDIFIYCIMSTSQMWITF